MQELIHEWSEDNCISKLFLNHVKEILKFYLPFVKFLEKTKSILYIILESRFHSFLSICENRLECGNQTLKELLFRPVQRLPSIIMLLKNIQSFTPEYNPDYETLQETIEALNNIIMLIQKSKSENLIQFEQQQFDDVENFPEIHLPIYIEPPEEDDDMEFEDFEDLTIIMTVANRTRPRPIVIDGSNIARTHGSFRNFSCKAIHIAVDFFLKLGHRDVKVFLPEFRRDPKGGGAVKSIDHHLLGVLDAQNHLVFTPTRTVDGKNTSCYDDRMIVQLAVNNNGVIVSNDKLRDIKKEKAEFAKAIEERRLRFRFEKDVFSVSIDDKNFVTDGTLLHNYLKDFEKD